MGWILRGWVVAILGLSLLTSCGQDPFECGVAVGSVRTLCDRPGEFCVCQTRRCAAPDEECSDGSGFGYTRGGDCVSADHFGTRLPVGVTGDAALCPGETGRPVECGLTEGITCLAGEECVCSTNRCARRDDLCVLQGSRYRYVESGVCVEPGDDEPQRLASKDDGTTIAGLCSAAVRCGRPGATPCLPGETCVCQVGRCARPDSCSSRLRFVDGEQECVGSNVAAPETLAPVTEEVAMECAGVLPCGLPGRIDCRDGEICVCATNRCARASTDEACTSTGARWAYVDDSECVAPEVSRMAGLLDYPLDEGESGVCPAIPCSGTTNNCLFGETCVCNSGRCARSGDTSCDAELRYVDGGLECVPGTDFPETYVAANAGGEVALCALAPPCGVSGGMPCGTSQVCVCGDHRCAVEDDSCLMEGSRYRHVDDDTCVPSPLTDPDGLLGAPEMLCGAPPCNGAANTCPPGETCLCATGECAHEDESCVPDGSRLRVVGGNCATAPAAAFIAATPDLCEPRRRCGLAGAFGCLASEVCNCLTGACLLPDDDCPDTGYRAVAGSCLDEDADLSGILADRALSCTERQQCGRSGDPPCDASDVCVCATGRCAEADDSCVPESRLRETVTGDCVSTDDAMTVVSADRVCAEIGCGARGGTSCAVGEFCLCGGHQCAVLDDACESRFRLLGGACAESAGVRDGVLAVTDPVHPPLCDSPDVLPTECGTTSGAVCDGADVCVCGAPYRDCAYLEPACSATGYAWRGTGGCVIGLTREEIESSEVDADGACVPPSTGASR